ncbi:4'-phosphopantetheinyl transferase family protein [Thermoactinospora rubra]|uniref:4'-phosphopantetheinyl transferase family protein n=1 Tax=Thermoactinospora rubra TaxID=1088767 RepID=UPI001F0A78CB|nr:phosphopantetheinyl transferase-like protein [Thermoactinospora rubra]
MPADPIAAGARPEEVDAPPSWLTPVERERAGRLRQEADRRAFVAAHLLVRLCAAEFLGRHPGTLTLLQRCPVHGPGHGVPYLEEAPGLGVSLSHTRGYVCAAVGEGRVGVDAERVPDGPLDEALAGMVLAPGERVTGNRELIRLWARKEALIKRGELTLDGMRGTPWRPRGHLLEWETPDGVLVAVVTDAPARRLGVGELAASAGSGGWRRGPLM